MNLQERRFCLTVPRFRLLPQRITAEWLFYRILTR